MAVPAEPYYGKYHGHKTTYLAAVEAALRADGGPDAAVAWLVGDSSLDNKFWLPCSRTRTPAVNGFEAVLSPPSMKRDVAYWTNKYLADAPPSGTPAPFCINAAVEESTIGNRKGALLPQDEFVRDQMRAEDTLIVSVGGNDIALRPTAATAASILALVTQPMSWLEKGSALGLGHMIRLFKDSVETYLAALCAKTRPKKIVICMIYYLDDDPESESWANATLRCLGYNSNPGKLQLLIRRVYQEATCKIKVDGVVIEPFPLFEVLDGKSPAEHEARVEPSVIGGEKMGKAFAALV